MTPPGRSKLHGHANSAPCSPTATSTPTGPTTSSANASETTPSPAPVASSPPDAHSRGNAPGSHRAPWPQIRWSCLAAPMRRRHVADAAAPAARPARVDRLDPVGDRADPHLPSGQRRPRGNRRPGTKDLRGHPGAARVSRPGAHDASANALRRPARPARAARGRPATAPGRPCRTAGPVTTAGARRAHRPPRSATPARRPARPRGPSQRAERCSGMAS
jgi:hypothetical protein